MSRYVIKYFGTGNQSGDRNVIGHLQEQVSKRPWRALVLQHCECNSIISSRSHSPLGFAARHREKHMPAGHTCVKRQTDLTWATSLAHSTFFSSITSGANLRDGSTMMPRTGYKGSETLGNEWPQKPCRRSHIGV